MSRPFLVSFISALPVNVVHDKSFTRPTVGSHPTDLVSAPPPLHPLYGLVFEAHFKRVPGRGRPVLGSRSDMDLETCLFYKSPLCVC